MRLNLVDANCVQIAPKKIKPGRLGLISLSATFLKINFIYKYKSFLLNLSLNQILLLKFINNKKNKE